ncbi:SKP1-like protein 4 [Ananas comosus]|uniref:SKP1-like protein 4 n=1 Tax=Ananas comosus TaxID=4615 RepID=A0A6P5H5C7_ANACO|nr:SKP1-like protein 4 [Ananas comosus]
MASQDCEAAASSRAAAEEQKTVRVAASSRAKKKEQKTVRVAASSSRAEKEEQKEERRTVRVTSNDGEEFEMDEAVARGSVMLRHMMELGIALDGVTLPIVSGEILALAVSYLRFHRDYDDGGSGYGYGYSYGYHSESEDTALTNFDRDLVKQLDQATLLDLLAKSGN